METEDIYNRQSFGVGKINPSPADLKKKEKRKKKDYAIPDDFFPFVS